MTELAYWRDIMHYAVVEMLAKTKGDIGEFHIRETPDRVVAMYESILSGCDKNPAEVLKLFPANNADQMVHVKNIVVYSVCAHHLLPFFGVVSFSYIPDHYITGLSKIPRMIDILARRPQIQEKLTQDIVGTFFAIVRPKGCAAVMRAYHLCMLMRGVQEHRAYTETTALRGCFKDDSVKQEFLSATRQDGPIWG